MRVFPANNGISHTTKPTNPCNKKLNIQIVFHNTTSLLPLPTNCSLRNLMDVCERNICTWV